MVACYAASLRKNLLTHDDTQQRLTRDLDSTKSQLTSVQHQLTTVQRSYRQQTQLLTRAISSLTSLAGDMSKVVAENDQ